MLDPEVIKIAQDMLDAEYAARSQRFASAVERTQSELAIKGLGRSGALLKAVADLCAHEVEDRAQRAWEILRTTLEETRVRFSADLAAELKKAFDNLFARYCVSDPEGTLNTARMAGGGNIDAVTFGSFHSREMGARQGVWAKIDLFVSSLRQQDETDGASRTNVFLSHAAADAPIGRLLKNEIQARLPGVTVFCSSDPTDLPPGMKWSPEIQHALENSGMLLLVASRRGLQRPWVWFECGTVWFRKRKIVPLCLGDTRKGTLPTPLSELQAVNADDVEDLAAAFELIASESGVTLVNSKNLQELAEKLKTLDAKASTESVAGSGWLGAPWDGKFLAYDGPYQLLQQIEDEPFVSSMQTALNEAGYHVVMVGRQPASSREQGFRIVYLTDKKSWRQRIVKGDVMLLARPETEH
jgi:hypothetical protein